MNAIESVAKTCRTHCDLERFIPHLSKVSKSTDGTETIVTALMDVVVFGGFPATMVNVDVTIRSPHALKGKAVNEVKTLLAGFAVIQSKS